MQEKNVVTIDYLGDPERFADFLNARWFGGRKVLWPENIQECKPASSRIWKNSGTLHTSEVIRDLVRKVQLGSCTILVALEAQSDIHYAMPVRVMNGDSMQYHEQWRRIRRRHRKKKDLRGAQYLSGFSRNDTVYPVVTLVIYFGRKPWDGPRSLREMMAPVISEEFPPGHSDNFAQVQAHIVDYPLWLTEVRSFPHLEYFRTDLGIVFGFLANDSDPGKLRIFLAIHKKEFQSLREDAYDMITVMSQDWKLAEIKQDYQNEKGEVNMCKAIDGLLKEEFQNGEENGIRLTKKVFLLWNSGTPKAEIAKKCDISPEKVNRILEWDE